MTKNQVYIPELDRVIFFEDGQFVNKLMDMYAKENNQEKTSQDNQTAVN